MQALRLKRTCTTEEDFTEQSKAARKRLVEKGYNANEIQQQILDMDHWKGSSAKPENKRKQHQPESH